MNSPRQHQNVLTAWIDGSQVYGSDEAGARNLRAFKNGKLRTSGKNLLPRIQDNEHNLFLAGDIRVNENAILTSYHTIFVREHNRVCDQLIRQYPHLNDEQLFQAARNFVIGLLQKISVEEFLPILLGSQYQTYISRSFNYKPFLNPNIPAEFSTAVFRIGHPLLIDKFNLVDKNGRKYRQQRLRDLFFHPQFVEPPNRIGDIFRGLATTLMKQKSAEVIDEVRNLLVSGPDNRDIKLDLVSLNLQRARDHGIPTYNQARQAYNLPKVYKFQDINPDPKKAEALKKVYNNRIDDVELFIGIISEPPVPEGVYGQLGCVVVGQAFRNLREGDRFWYEYAFPPSVIK